MEAGNVVIDVGCIYYDLKPSITVVPTSKRQFSKEINRMAGLVSAMPIEHGGDSK